MAPGGLKPILKKLAAGEHLDAAAMTAAMETILDGNAEDAAVAGFLMAIEAREASPEEITAAARALRARATTVSAPADCVDTCGTGGDGGGAFNISTAAAIVAAGAGVRVAKHGNRAVSSKSGSSDVLSALGVNLQAPLETVERAIEDVGIGFLFAPNHHPAVRHAAAARAALGVRTLFNLIGPLANPAGARRQVLGVYAERLLEPMAAALRDLGSAHALIVHGSDGLDELTTTGPSLVAELTPDGAVRRYEITPEDAGLKRARPEDLEGGGPAENAEAIRRLLSGEPGPARDIVVLNAAATILVADLAPDLDAAARTAERAIDTGSAAQALRSLVDTTNR
ncbi:MAG: anthranilate phosphoribosyltransferase [Pseudomonadota bacterium]